VANDFRSLGQKDFSGGYHPGDDFINGAPNALVRMDNVWLDTTGALEVTRSCFIFSSNLGSPVIGLFSSILNNVKFRFAALNNGKVLMDPAGAGTYPTQLIAAHAMPAGTLPPAFGQGFGHVFVAANGGRNVETDGTTVWNWGLGTQQSPGIDGKVLAVAFPWYPQPLNLAAFTLITGSLVAVSTSQYTAQTNGSGVLSVTSQASTININVSTLTSDTGAATDIFYLLMYIGLNPATTTSIAVTATTSGGNFYKFTFTAPNFGFISTYTPGWVVMACSRSQFVATGAPNWASIVSTNITVNSTVPGSTYIISTPWEFYNANDASANLNSFVVGAAQSTPAYIYIEQNQWNNSQFSGLSGASVPSMPVIGKYQSVNVSVSTSGIDSRVNQMNVFRNGGRLGGTFWLVVSIPAPFLTFTDPFPDTNLQLQAGSNVNLSPFLTDLKSFFNTGAQIIGIEGPINGRMVFITTQNIYILDFLNPEAYDARLVLTVSANNSEQLLFITKTTQNILLVGTTVDIYQISGTMQFLPGGVFDVSIVSLGIKQPPISPTFSVIDNQLLWIAKDGLRQSFISLVSQLSVDLNTLFRGAVSNGVSGFNIKYWPANFSGSTNNEIPIVIAIAKQKIYIKILHNDATTSIFVLDLQHKNWYRKTESPIPLTMFSEQDDILVGGYADGFVRFIENVPNPGGTPPSLNILTICKDSGEPNTRKDLMALKLVAATNGDPITLSLVNDSNTSVSLGAFSSNGVVPKLIGIPCNGISIDGSRKYALQITGTPSYFKLDNWQLDVYSHPEPHIFYREPPNNFGKNSRKRVRTLPIVLDCLGSNVSMQAIVDGANVGTPTVFTGTGKQTYYYMFSTDVNGVDYSYTLSTSGTFFEPYGMMDQVDVEEFPPPKLEDQIGPLILDKRGKIYGFQVRMQAATSSINYQLWLDDSLAFSSSFVTTPNIDTAYEVLRMPLSMIGNVVRLVFITPDLTKPFYRWDCSIRATSSGMTTNQKWFKLS
jgi:hypothetical protein